MAVTKEGLYSAQVLAQRGILDAPKAFKIAAIELLLSVCNGCGAAGSFFRPPSTIYGVDITPACQIHDFAFYLGQTLKEFNKANSQFYKNIKVLLDISPSFIKPKHLMAARALIYYKAVCWFGLRAFYAGKVKVKQAIKKVKL